jgi:signal transduction histidine kinase
MHTNVLKQLPLFAGLPDDKLTWLIDNAEQVDLMAGDVLIEEGSPPDAFYVVLAGEFEVVKRAGGSTVLLALNGPGEMLGEMSLIQNSARTATVRAVRTSRILKISRDLFETLLCGNPATAMAILRTVMVRLHNTQSMMAQNEKLMSLGTLAAGLAHELNNPAAAARRSTGQLRATVNDWLSARGSLDASQLTPEQREVVVCRLRDDLAGVGRSSQAPDPLVRSDREYEIETWLEDAGLENAFQHASSLVAFGWELPALQAWSSQFQPRDVPEVVRWLATGYQVDALLDEVATSAERISEIVKAVKDYSYLDQSPLQEIDVREGLESTLMILKHKLQHGVTVTRDYAKDLPRVEAYASELNQVWTNIIDNAIDAMKGQGNLELRTYATAHEVVVEITDSGSGIPPDVLPRIFEPFYTTKGPGVGTGLGLHVSHNIVQKHRGKIDVHSRPGHTQFVVSLPFRTPNS